MSRAFNHHWSRRASPGDRIWAGRTPTRTGGQCPASYRARSKGAGEGATRCLTPRQACPRPEGFGRNLRSKTRWFTGFCNSHQVSHFATFFIDARAEISVAESRFDFQETYLPPPALTANGARVGDGRFISVFLGAFRAGFRYPKDARERTSSGEGRRQGGHAPMPQPMRG